MHQEPGDFLKKWLNDPSFHNWAKNSNAADYQQWEDWLMKNAAYRNLAETAALIIKGIRFRDIPVNEQENAAALEKMWQRLSYTAQPSARVRSIQAYGYKFGLRLAASIALLLFAGIFLYHQLAIRPYVEVHTNYGEKIELVLPDQTVVVLNANSELRYAKQNPRKVWLTGEALFQVKKKPETNEKFLVLTNDLTVEVLGTVFNVNSREKKTEVFLEEGKVKLNLKDKAKSDVMLSPGDVLTYSANQNNPYRKARSEAKLHTSWKDGVLILKGTPLQEVIQQMEDLYGVRITLQNDTLARHKMTMAIPIENVDIALATLENTLGLHIQQQSNGEYWIE